MTLADEDIMDIVSTALALQLDLTMTRYEFRTDLITSRMTRRRRVLVMARAYGYEFEEMEALIGVEWR